MQGATHTSDDDGLTLRDADRNGDHKRVVERKRGQTTQVGSQLAGGPKDQVGRQHQLAQIPLGSGWAMKHAQEGRACLSLLGKHQPWSSQERFLEIHLDQVWPE